MLAASLLLFVAAPPSAVADIQIVYRADDLPDAEPGDDLWQYTYTVSGWPFAELDGFRIYFPTDSFADIAVIDFPSTWDAVALVPDEIFPDQAFLAQALQPTSSTAVFIVEFRWLGDPVTAPGSQRAELFDANLVVFDPPGTLGTQVIPEPQTGLLMLAGLALLAVSAGRRIARSFLR
jgi:hypothetical protein